MSDDGRFAFVVIAMVGNPFSPWYAQTRGDALGHAAMNVCLYVPGARKWALTERRIEASARSERAIAIGESLMTWERGSLVVVLDERTSPGGAPIRGRIAFEPTTLAGRSPIALDEGGAHAWWPIAPRGRFLLELDEPRLRIAGHGYHDANAGSVPLEDSFSRWAWSRAPMRDGRTLLAYDVVDRAGREQRRAWIVGADGERAAVDVPGARLPSSAWFRIRRDARGDEARVVRTLEDTPFYARTLVEATVSGERVLAMHEALSLDRFRARWVRALLGYRMARER